MGKSYLPGKVLLWIVAVYHVGLGLMLIVSGQLTIRVAKLLAGWTIEGSPLLDTVAEMFGCYMLAFGLMMGAAAWNPVKNRAAITIGVILIALRLLQRLFFAAKITEVFQVSGGHHWGFFVLVLVIGVLLALFRLQIYRDMHAAGGTEAPAEPA
ncbi:MAG: hypothetical protein GY856_44440 [bacterium]|nr:hypothetical protein [bacterium]